MMSQVTSLLTTLHVITDWPTSDHMIRTLHRGPVRQSVFHCVRRTQRALDRGAAHSQGARTARKCRPFINGHPTLHCHRPAVYMQRPVGKWL
ncbi:unnamed protein product, partial [Staurois parvus]